VTVAGARGTQVPLSLVATLRERRDPVAIHHVDRERSVTVWLRPIAPLTPATRTALSQRVAAVQLPARVRVVPTW
jgi:multidrug efflux pump subunit AcrB